MAIFTGGLLGSSRNRVGSIVTYRLKGQDVARSLAANVSNPRTRAQMEQRVRLANLVSFYRANKPWMDGLAFSARPQQWSDYNAFVSANLNSNRVFLTKAEAAAGTCIVAPYRVSEGNLPSVSVTEQTNGVYATNLYVGDVNPTTDTIAGVTAALLANNNGLYEGMQLSLIVNYQQQIGGVYRAVVRYYEVILSLTDGRLFSEVMSDQHIAYVQNSIGFTAGANDPVMGFAFIISADQGGKTLTSTQYLTLTDSTLYDTYTTESALNAAIESYGGGLLGPFLSGGYQNSSSGSVELPLSILSVNGKAAGQFYGTISAHGTPLVVTFNRAIASTPTTTIVGQQTVGTTRQTWGEGDGSSAITSTLFNGAVSIDTKGIGSGNSAFFLVSISIQVDGQIYGITFSTTESTPDGDITE